MKVSMRDKKILLMFIGILVFFVGWYFGYRPQMEKADQIEASNGALEEQLQDLLELAADKDFYVSETASIKDKISEYISEFPADVRPEDGIVLANKMENELGFQITNVGVGEKEFVASIDGSSEEDLQNDSDEAADQSSDSQVPVLYRTQVTLQFNGTYAGLKKAVLYVADQSGRMTLDNVNASYDTSTGNLTGTIIVNIFSMSGTERTYTEPDAGSVAYGTDNIFGTVESKTPTESTEQNTDAQSTDTQADTAETEAQPAQ